MHQWQVLTRAECSLCDTLLMELATLLGDEIAQVQLCDVSEDTMLERKYGTRIPVLLIDGEFVCAYKLDHERVREYLKQD
jgi:predicted thioredoxin/glutaredoxin